MTVVYPETGGFLVCKRLGGAIVMSKGPFNDYSGGTDSGRAIRSGLDLDRIIVLAVRQFEGLGTQT